MNNDLVCKTLFFLLAHFALAKSRSEKKKDGVKKNGKTMDVQPKVLSLLFFSKKNIFYDIFPLFCYHEKNAKTPLLEHEVQT